MKRAVPAGDRFEREAGMILINVLVIVMLATAILALTIAGDDSDIELTIRLREAAEANAVLRGGELSAIAALRRDLAGGNDIDGSSDEWATIADQDAAIDGGTFTFAVFDAQAKFNLNNLRSRDALTIGRFAGILAQVELPVDVAANTAELIRVSGPLRDPGDLSAIGLAPAQIVQLAPYVTVLPEPTTINLNTAPEELLAIVLANQASVQRLLAIRRRVGGISRSDMVEAGIFPPPGTGTSSQYFWSAGAVNMGGTQQRMTSLLYRQTTDGKPEVLAIKRWRGTAPLQVQPLP